MFALKMATKRRNLFSTLFAFLCWLFLRQPSVKHISQVFNVNSKGQIILTPQNIDRLFHGNWYIVVGDITDESRVNHLFTSNIGFARLEIKDFMTAKIACMLGVRKQGEIIAFARGNIYSVHGNRMMNPHVCCLDVFDYYFHFKCQAIRQQIKKATSAEDLVLTAAEVCNEFWECFAL